MLLEVDGIETCYGLSQVLFGLSLAIRPGEMVSLTVVEQIATTLWPQAASVAVSIPDQRKGERIVLITTQKDAERAAMQRQAKAQGAPELAVPAVVMVVDKIPLLGSGKTDYVGAKVIAEEAAKETAQAAPEREAEEREVA